MRSMRPRFLAVLLLSLVTAGACAQTVESVLNALQERQQMILMRDVITEELKRELNALEAGAGEANYAGITFDQESMIVWPDLTEKYLEPNTVTELEKALKLLNYASEVFDAMKSKFLAYDPNKGALVNQELVAELTQDFVDPNTPDGVRRPGHASVQYSSIVLPSVGVFTEENWRTKIRILASNIEQLRALPWPARGLGGSHSFVSEWRGGDLNDFIWEHTNHDGDIDWDWLEEPFQFPWILRPRSYDPQQPDLDATDYVEGLGSRNLPVPVGSPGEQTQRLYYKGNEAFSWNAGAGYRTDFIDSDHVAHPPKAALGNYDHNFGGVVALKSRVRPEHSDDYGVGKFPSWIKPIGAK